MPLSTLIIVWLIVAAFATFMIPLAWVSTSLALSDRRERHAKAAQPKAERPSPDLSKAA